MGVLLPFTRSYLPPPVRERRVSIFNAALRIADMADAWKDDATLHSKVTTFAEAEIERLMERAKEQ